MERGDSVSRVVFFHRLSGLAVATLLGSRVCIIRASQCSQVGPSAFSSVIGSVSIGNLNRAAWNRFTFTCVTQGGGILARGLLFSVLAKHFLLVNHSLNPTIKHAVVFTSTEYHNTLKILSD